MTQALHGKARNLAQRLYDAAGVFMEEAMCGHGYYEFYTLDDEVWVRFKPSPDWKMFRVEVQDPSEEYCQLEVDLNFDELAQYAKDLGIPTQRIIGRKIFFSPMFWKNEKPNMLQQFKRTLGIYNHDEHWNPGDFQIIEFKGNKYKMCCTSVQWENEDECTGHNSGSTWKVIEQVEA